MHTNQGQNSLPQETVERLTREAELVAACINGKVILCKYKFSLIDEWQRYDPVLDEFNFQDYYYRVKEMPVNESI